MSYISLSFWDLGLAGFLVFLLGLISLQRGLGLFRPLMLGALRTTVQLLLVSLVLKYIFGTTSFFWVILMALIMLAAASREVLARKQRRFKGVWGFGLGAAAMMLAAFSVVTISLTLMIRPDPWYAPRFAIPMLGMMLGNTMNAIGLSLDRLTQGAWQQRREIEARLLMGQDWRQAILSLRRESTLAGMMPVLNGLATVGLVSLPGMMTGQILAGAEPLEAVKYQILIMFILAASTGFGTLLVVLLASRRLFDERQRLRLDRLRARRA